MTPYPRLFAPLRLGNLTLRNRVVFSAHLTNYAENGLPTEQHASYYEARARGGAGLIITEEHSTHPSDRPYEKMIAGYRPEAIRGIPADHRRRSCTWFVDSRADQPQWGPGRWNLFAIAAVGAERRRRSVVPRGAQSCRRRGHRRDSRRVRPCCPQLRRRWLRRGGIAGVAVVHSARVSRPLDQRAHRSLRRGRGTSCTVPSRSARGTA